MFDQIPQSRMEAILQNLRSEMGSKSLTMRALSELATPGSPNTVSKLFSGKAITLPSYIALEEALEMEPGALMRLTPTATVEDIGALLEAVEKKTVGLKLRNGPSVVQFLQWYNECGGEVSTDSEMLEHIDIYDAPTDSGFLVNPVRLGKKSLLSKKMGHVPADLAVEKLAEGNRRFTAQTASDHKEVLQGRSIFDEREVDQVLNGVVITGRFERALQLGTWAGQKVVLNFANEV